MRKSFNWLDKALSMLGEQKISGIEKETTPESLSSDLDLHWLYEHLHYRTFHDKGYYQNRSSSGFVLKLTPLVGFSEQVEKDLIMMFQDILPVHSNLQCLLYANPHNEEYLAHWREATCDNFSLQKIAKSRIQHFHQHKRATFRQFEVYLSFSQPKEIRHVKDEKKLCELSRQITTMLGSFGMQVTVATPQILMDFLHQFLYQMKSRECPAYSEHEMIAAQVKSIGSKIAVSEDGVGIDAHQIRSYSLKRLPFTWSGFDMQSLIGDEHNDERQIPCPFVIQYGVHILPEAKGSAKLAKAARVDSQVNSPIGKYLPQLKRESDEWGFVRSRLESGDKFVSTHFQVSLVCPKEDVITPEQKLLSIFKSSGFELTFDPHIQLPLLLSILPMHWSEGWYEELNKFARTKTALSYEPANFLPLQGEWLGTGSPYMLLSGRRGQLINWSPFDNTAGNYNVSVVGRSGSGKSVFMQELMVSTLRLGGRVFVLDVGRSFEKICHLLNGTFMTFESKRHICINPFSHIPEHLSPEEVDDTLAFITPILSLMAAPKAQTNDKETALLNDALITAWGEHKQNAQIGDIISSLKAMNDKTASDLAIQLSPYSGKGTYARFFEGQANVDLSNPLVVIELEELKERKDLQAVVMQMMIVHITNMMFLGDRKTPFSIIFDEAWDLLRGGASGQFIEMLARRLRKYNGSLVVGTQSVNDFYQSAGAQAAFDNSDWMCFLSQKEDSIRALKSQERLNLEGGLEHALKSLKMVKGEYAEVLIKSEYGFAINRLMLDPYSALIYSTSAEDYAKVNQLRAEGMSVDKALAYILEERGHVNS